MRTRVLPPCVILLGVGCAPERPAPTPPDTAEQVARCPVSRPPEQAGRVSADRPVEASGLAYIDGVLWTHDDSGGLPELYALSPGGDLRATVSLTGAIQRDWEDLAVWRGADGTKLVVGDIGDNLAVHPSVVLYVVDVPGQVTDGSSPARAVTAIYEDGPRDAEALIVDDDGTFFILTKSFSGETGVYEGSLHDDTTPQVLSRRHTLVFGDAPLAGDRLVTAAAVDPLGRGVIVRTYLNLWWFPKRPSASAVDAFVEPPCRLIGAEEQQGEAVALDGENAWTLSEGSLQPIWKIPLQF